MDQYNLWTSCSIRPYDRQEVVLYYSSDTPIQKACYRVNFDTVLNIQGTEVVQNIHDVYVDENLNVLMNPIFWMYKDIFNSAQHLFNPLQVQKNLTQLEEWLRVAYDTEWGLDMGRLLEILEVIMPQKEYYLEPDITGRCILYAIEGSGQRILEANPIKHLKSNQLLLYGDVYEKQYRTDTWDSIEDLQKRLDIFHNSKTSTNVRKIEQVHRSDSSRESGTELGRGSSIQEHTSVSSASGGHIVLQERAVQLKKAITIVKGSISFR